MIPTYSYYTLNIKLYTINIKRFSPDQQTPKDIDVLYVGALRPRKQVDKIIIAFSELIKKKSNVRLGIVGNGFLENELKSLVEDIGITENVHFFGFQKDVLPFLKRAKIFIMASKMEGLPVALMEAMACENTVIAPAVDNIPTVLIDKRTGYLMNSTSQEVVNKTLIEAYNNFHKDLHIRRSAREMIIDNYSYQSAISKWSSLLNNF
ncbi:MAG: glycosyltransferase [Candidatus Woesearchaeota archaeon]